MYHKWDDGPDGYDCFVDGAAVAAIEACEERGWAYVNTLGPNGEFEVDRDGAGRVIRPRVDRLTGKIEIRPKVNK